MAEEGLEDPFTPRSIGERLKEAREASGIPLEQIASQTRIPIRHLQHIENEEWDALPAVTYSIGFARAYANAVGLDGAEVSREVRDRLGGLRSRAPAAEYYEPADPARVPPRALAIVVGIIVILFVGGYLVWRSGLGGGETSAPSASVSVPLDEAQGPAQPIPQPQQPAAPQALAGQPVTLTATQEVWLRITDASGGPALFNGIMTPGQTFTLPATAQGPVIRTGRPQVLRVTIGGRDIGPIDPVERTISDVSLRAEDIAARIQAAGAPAGATPPAAQPPTP
ncbi:DUF4115 domain-containing protein [Sphingosinicella sp. LHD-64]|uniref:helix-turn-helix domain-containing protein n=1 Tax=Sphingosinicella sp. LHD-64 TaxID=3072139 RepID=UPI00280F1DE7|nr:RodZ domain-containing protein [Sphingosinicella sp. LHD-64]MDQ8758066.1 DUF4115 domain-containing protein [Sphingosinicella sp. LHD-64]